MMWSRVWWGVWVLILSWATGQASPVQTAPASGGQVVFSTRTNVSDVEMEIGRAAARDMEKRYGLYNDAAANARVNRLGNLMARLSGCQSSFQFRVLNADEPNGVSLPGGFIYVTRGLLRLLPEDDLLTAALGHEVGHIALGHMAELLRQQGQAAPRAPEPEAAAARPDPFAPLPNQAPRENPTHAREKAADRAAARYLRAANIDARVMVLLLQRLSRQPELNADASQTHPTWPDRIHSLESYLRSAEFQSLPKATPGAAATPQPGVEPPATTALVSPSGS